MAEQVGPANGKPITTVAFEAVYIDWLPLARIPSWPGAASPNRMRPKIRLQSDSCLSLVSPSTLEMPRRYGRVKAKPAFGGALRAALTRPTRRGLGLGCGEGQAFAAIGKRNHDVNEDVERRIRDLRSLHC